MNPASAALRRLREGNRRFAAGASEMTGRASAMRREEFLAAQSPFAVVLGCSDSRVPVEIVFDQGLGDLFVVRVAGNIAELSQVESVEFAVENLGTELVVVLGHSGCGAVQAALEALRDPDPAGADRSSTIVEWIRPTLESLVGGGKQGAPEAVVSAAIRGNVRRTADRLRSGSDVLGRRVRAGSLRIVGAEYSMDTGVVDFFDDPTRSEENRTKKKE
ncbi:MAG: carbonic anhydrase [Candidatus Eisenbacteria bacterium]|nr:carbonic anhydrase [Candidatus Latescibacterota bacterium]MBD3303380.1 carbonic anhydrase [Candidatus Eisenbacteria bacterium]